MARPLLGRRILLTGASRGIGRAVAMDLLSAGAELSLLGRDVAALESVFGDGRGHVQQADLAVAIDAEAIVAQASAALGGLDAVVHCAGTVSYQPLLRVDSQAVDHQFRVNFLSPLALTLAAGRAMADGGGGDMVFVASTLFERPVVDTAVYSASKAALVSLCRSCALELGPLGIRANAVAPGVIDTDMIRKPRPSTRAQAAQSPDEALAAQHAQLVDLHPIGRLGRPAEVAEAVRYLLTSGFVNGTVLKIDGGVSLA